MHVVATAAITITHVVVFEVVDEVNLDSPVIIIL